MSHNPYRPIPTPEWTDQGIDLTPPTTLHDRIVSVLHDSDGLQIKLEDSQRKVEDLRRAVNDAIKGLNRFAYTDTPSQKDELTELLSGLEAILIITN